MYAEIAWVLVFSGTQVQPHVILDPDYLPDYLSVFITMIKKRLQHRSFRVKCAKFHSQNTSGGINKKRSKVHKQRVLLKIICYYRTGWLLHEAFSVSLWNKTKTSSCSLIAENTVFVTSEPKIVDYYLLHSKHDVQSDSNSVHIIFFCFSHSVLCKVS